MKLKGFLLLVFLAGFLLDEIQIVRQSSLGESALESPPKTEAIFRGHAPRTSSLLRPAAPAAAPAPSARRARGGTPGRGRGHSSIPPCRRRTSDRRDRPGIRSRSDRRYRYRMRAA